MVPSTVQRQVEVLAEVHGTPADADGPLAEAGQPGVTVHVNQSGAGIAGGKARERRDAQRRPGVRVPDMRAVLEDQAISGEGGQR
jgi:hypothetical protein